ncbi:hypothetical protein D3C74_452120 [compost metagenome]
MHQHVVAALMSAPCILLRRRQKRHYGCCNLHRQREHLICTPHPIAEVIDDDRYTAAGGTHRLFLHLSRLTVPGRLSKYGGMHSSFLPLPGSCTHH